jgi:4-alpha-glucanotransferase
MSERAVRLGIETDYLDAFGRRRSSDPDAIARIMDILSQNGERSPDILPQSMVIRDRRDRRLKLDLPAQHEIAWSIAGPQRAISGASVSPFLDLPNELPVGTYRLRATIRSPSGAENSEETTLLLAPERAYQGDANSTRRVWALAVQLYGVRSHRNWGHGDFTDLAGMIDLACDLGAAGVALNPLHAPFDDPAEPSPYSPNSRLFLNPRYIDPDAVPEFPGVHVAGIEQEIAALRQSEMIDYRSVVAAKTRALGLAYQAFLQRGDANRRQAFERFRQERGSTLARFAAFEHLRSRFRKPWWEWPTEWQVPDDDALKILRTAHENSIAFHEYVQWIADEQLAYCRDRAAQRGMPIGLYLDLAVGVRPNGFDAWNSQDTLLRRAEIGAPPDVLNTAGQKWGLAGVNPIGLERSAFEPFRDVLRASMRYAGALRIDHVLGLQRLYLVPSGMAADKGVYVRLPFHALLAVIAQESIANKCIVIGEDLGTVPENFRETLADWGVWSYQVLLFERAADGSFHAPENYRENALATFATHDLPTFAGWLGRHDLEVKRRLAMDPGETDDERRAAHSALWNALSGRGMAALDFSSVVQFLASTPSRLLVVSMEDTLGSAEQVNVPGTVDEHPNWRRRLAVDLEDLKNQEGLIGLAEVLRAVGRSVRSTEQPEVTTGL